MIGQNEIGIGEGRRRGSLWKWRVLGEVHVERAARLWRIDCFSKSLLWSCITISANKREESCRVGHAKSFHDGPKKKSKQLNVDCMYVWIYVYVYVYVYIQRKSD